MFKWILGIKKVSESGSWGHIAQPFGTKGKNICPTRLIPPELALRRFSITDPAVILILTSKSKDEGREITTGKMHVLEPLCAEMQFAECRTWP